MAKFIYTWLMLIIPLFGPCPLSHHFHIASTRSINFLSSYGGKMGDDGHGPRVTVSMDAALDKIGLANVNQSRVG